MNGEFQQKYTSLSNMLHFNIVLIQKSVLELKYFLYLYTQKKIWLNKKKLCLFNYSIWLLCRKSSI